MASIYIFLCNLLDKFRYILEDFVTPKVDGPLLAGGGTINLRLHQLEASFFFSTLTQNSLQHTSLCRSKPALPKKFAFTAQHNSELN